MSCAAARINNATDWQIPLATARGILISTATYSINTKKRGWTIQHHPTSNPSKALPDSPGRAARKPAGKKIQLSGTDVFYFRSIHGGRGSEKQVPGLVAPLWTRKTRLLVNAACTIHCYCRRIRLQIDCRQ